VVWDDSSRNWIRSSKSQTLEKIGPDNCHSYYTQLLALFCRQVIPRSSRKTPYNPPSYRTGFQSYESYVILLYCIQTNSNLAHGLGTERKRYIINKYNKLNDRADPSVVIHSSPYCVKWAAICNMTFIRQWTMKITTSSIYAPWHFSADLYYWVYITGKASWILDTRNRKGLFITWSLL
jgi:hypothetical protein